MTGNFAANARLLENVHRLQQQRVSDAEISYELFDFGCARKVVERWIQIVERVADLVDRLLLTLPQRAIRKEGVLFEEETNLVS